MVFWGCVIGAEAGFYVKLTTLEGLSGFYYPENILTREQIEGFWEDASEDAKREIQDITLFRETAGRTLKNVDLGRERKVKLVETAGSMNLVTPDGLVAGAYVTDSDSKGCVLSKKTADSLFGDCEATGEQVVMGRSTYIVRGIVDTEGQLCMIQGEKGRAYPCIRIEAAGVPLSVVRQRLVGILPEGKGWCSECDLYLGIGRILVYLPLWVLFILLLRRIRKMLPEMLRPLALVIGFAGVCSLLLLSLHFSDDYVPTAWSDFQFFTQLFNEKKQAFLDLLYHPLYSADSQMLGSLVGILSATVVICGMLLKIRFEVVFNEISCENEENFQR